VGTSRFPGKAGYTRRLRCACTPRRPMSGSALSLSIPSRHVVLHDPGESVGCAYPVPSPTTLAFVHSAKTRHSRISHHYPLPAGPTFRGYQFAFRYDLPSCLPPLADPTGPFALPTETFTSGLPTGWSPFPPPGMTTVATGQVPPTGLPPAGMTASVAARKICGLILVRGADLTCDKAPFPSHRRSGIRRIVWSPLESCC